MRSFLIIIILSLLRHFQIPAPTSRLFQLALFLAIVLAIIQDIDEIFKT